MLVMARMLLPKDFGIIAVVLLVGNFIEVVANCGTLQFIMQSKLMDEARLGSAWGLDILLKTSVLILMYAILLVQAGYWDNPDITLAIALHSPTLLFRVLWNPRLHIDRRELKYRRIIKLQIFNKLFTVTVAIVLAIVTRSFWAVIIADIAGTLLICILSHIFWQRAPKPRLGHVREQWAFSGWMLARGILGYVKAQLDVVVVASVYPLASLGRYNFARELTVMPSEEIIKPAMEPLVSMFARLHSDRKALTVEVESTLLILIAVMTPFVIFLLGFSDSIVENILGPNWLGLEGLIVALTPLLPTHALGQLLGTLLISEGRVRALFAYDLISLACVAILLISIAGVSLGVLAFARAGLGIALTLPMLDWTLRRAGTSLVKNLSRIVVPILIGIFALWLSRYTLTSMLKMPEIVVFIISTSLFFGIYLITLYCFAARFASRHKGWYAIQTGVIKVASFSRLS